MPRKIFIYDEDKGKVVEVKQAPLRHDDKSGNVAGMELNKWTQEVHDRELEGNLKNLTVYRRIKLKWIPFTVRVLNLEGFPY